MKNILSCRSSVKIVMMAVLVILTLAACSHKEGTAVRSMYYWSTVFRLSDGKKVFLQRHNIRRLYVRYFDVVRDDDGSSVPNATIRFEDTVPSSMEVVPTVYIVNDCMREDADALAAKILRRIKQMNATNDIKGVKEIQIDCDWTNATRRRFFSFMTRLRFLAHADNMKVSATIRLHQLSQTPPPADRGILMLYNTGDFTRLDCHKPILDMHDVAPYLPQLAGYSLPLSAAYPIFGWRILFRQGQYVGIIHADDDLPVLPGDSIVIRQPSAVDVLAGVKAIEKRRSEANDEIILFDLTENNINRFKQEEYEEIFNRNGDSGVCGAGNGVHGGGK